MSFSSSRRRQGGTVQSTREEKKRSSKFWFLRPRFNSTIPEAHTFHNQNLRRQYAEATPINTMFYVKTLEHEIELEPIHFGQKLKATIIRLLKEEVEGLALANYGFVVNVIEVPEDQIRGNIIEYDTGNVVFFVKYTALLLRPFINEVVDATVAQCNELGFFAYVGPLRIFVSKHSMPEDMFNGFDGERDSWVSDDKEVVISSGCGVRLKIKGRTVEQGNITAIGTIKDNYLGLIDDGSGEGEGL